MLCDDCIHSRVCGLKHEMEIFDKSISDIVRSGHFKSFNARADCDHFQYGDICICMQNDEDRTLGDCE